MPRSEWEDPSPYGRYQTSGYRVMAGTYSGVTVFHLQGEIDVVTAPAMSAELDAWVGEDAVLFDLTGTDLIDSAGLGALLSTIRRLHEHGARAAIAARPPMERALRAAGFDRVVHLAPTPAAALGWLNQVTDDAASAMASDAVSDAASDPAPSAEARTSSQAGDR